jgi:hypothetical protein
MQSSPLNLKKQEALIFMRQNRMQEAGTLVAKIRAADENNSEVWCLPSVINSEQRGNLNPGYWQSRSTP